MKQSKHLKNIRKTIYLRFNKGDKMILYIYKLRNFMSKINDLPSNIIIQSQDENQVLCSVILDNFSRDIIVHPNSDFLFIIANKKSEKRKIFKLLYSIFKENLSYFRPTAEEEHDFICSYNEFSLKFIHDNKIEYSNNLTEEYCKKTLDRDYYFYEAKINLESIPNCYFLYYGDAIKIKDSFTNHIYSIIDSFENNWVVE